MNKAIQNWLTKQAMDEMNKTLKLINYKHQQPNEDTSKTRGRPRKMIRNVEKVKNPK